MKKIKLYELVQDGIRSQSIQLVVTANKLTTREKVYQYISNNFYFVERIIAKNKYLNQYDTSVSDKIRIESTSNFTCLDDIINEFDRIKDEDSICFIHLNIDALLIDLIYNREYMNFNRPDILINKFKLPYFINKDEGNEKLATNKNYYRRLQSWQEPSAFSVKTEKWNYGDIATAIYPNTEEKRKLIHSINKEGTINFDMKLIQDFVYPDNNLIYSRYRTYDTEAKGINTGMTSIVFMSLTDVETASNLVLKNLSKVSSHLVEISDIFSEEASEKIFKELINDKKYTKMAQRALLTFWNNSLSKKDDINKKRLYKDYILANPKKHYIGIEIVIDVMTEEDKKCIDIEKVKSYLAGSKKMNLFAKLDVTPKGDYQEAIALEACQMLQFSKNYTAFWYTIQLLNKDTMEKYKDQLGKALVTFYVGKGYSYISSAYIDEHIVFANEENIKLLAEGFFNDLETRKESVRKAILRRLTDQNSGDTEYGKTNPSSCKWFNNSSIISKHNKLAIAYTELLL